MRRTRRPAPRSRFSRVFSSQADSWPNILRRCVAFHVRLAAALSDADALRRGGRAGRIVRSHIYGGYGIDAADDVHTAVDAVHRLAVLLVRPRRIRGFT